MIDIGPKHLAYYVIFWIKAAFVFLTFEQFLLQPQKFKQAGFNFLQTQPLHEDLIALACL